MGKAKIARSLLSLRRALLSPLPLTLHILTALGRRVKCNGLVGHFMSVVEGSSHDYTRCGALFNLRLHVGSSRRPLSLPVPSEEEQAPKHVYLSNPYTGMLELRQDSRTPACGTLQ